MSSGRVRGPAALLNRRCRHPAWLRAATRRRSPCRRAGDGHRTGPTGRSKDMNDNGLTHYLEEARRFPMLSPERELALALAWRDKRDREALRQLVGSHLRF